jgi:isoquinoline 1-oxidoreductase subunit alpha
MPIRFKVNGRDVSANSSPETPLLWVLRDELGLKGTKFGCGIAQCGACTVHVDGMARRSCILPVSAVEEADVLTIEGLSPDATHPLQRAWEELDVPQCGYCQAGQIMSAAALLERTPQPTDEEIDQAMNGNLCRCATYLRIRQAIHTAAGLRNVDGAGNGGAANGSGHDAMPDGGGAPAGAGNGRGPGQAERESSHDGVEAS